jgi:hypothetical protein
MLYELAVETVETQTGIFTIMSAWDQVRIKVTSLGIDRDDYRGLGPTAATYTRYAVRDMCWHGLVTCARIDRPGRRCLAWRKIATPGLS